jgi:hypothetical protein
MSWQECAFEIAAVYMIPANVVTIKKFWILIRVNTPVSLLQQMALSCSGNEWHENAQVF